MVMAVGGLGGTDSVTAHQRQHEVMTEQTPALSLTLIIMLTLVLSIISKLNLWPFTSGYY